MVWICGISSRHKIDGEPEDIDPKELIRKATNLDFEMEILGTAPWVAHSLVADKYSDGRIFLAGDACHLHPPFGGYGMNMGIADGVDLGLEDGGGAPGGGAGPAVARELRAGAEADPQGCDRGGEAPIILRWAINWRWPESKRLDRTAMPRGARPRETIFAAKLREFKTLGVVLGYRYKDSAVILPDGTEPPAEHSMAYRPSAYPGCVAPHLWLEDGSSLYDHFGRGFTLMATRCGLPSDLKDCERAAQQLSLPLTILQLSEGRLQGR